MTLAVRDVSRGDSRFRPRDGATVMSHYRIDGALP